MVTLCSYHAADISPTIHAAQARSLPGLKAEVSREFDDPSAASVETLHISEGLVSRRPAALDAVGGPAPEPVWQPVDTRSRHEAGHQQQEQVGYDVQD
jgi:hypothetical protein